MDTREMGIDYRILDSGTTNTKAVGFRTPSNTVWFSVIPEDYVVVPTRQYNRLVEGSTATVPPVRTETEEINTVFRRFHATGVEKYGRAGWDDTRHMLVSIVTRGRTDSSKRMTVAEMHTAIALLEAL